MRNLTTIATLIAVCLSINLAQAQQIPSPNFRSDGIEGLDATRPFAEPGVFDYDAQMFAPLEFSEGKQLGGRSGFFGTFDRLYTSLSKAGHNQSTNPGVPVGSNYVWGNRINVGWMNDTDDGWSLEYSQSEGSYFSAGQDILIAQPMKTDTMFANVEVNKIFRQTLSQGGWIEPYIGMRFINFTDSTLEDINVQLGAAGTPLSSNRFKQNVSNNAIGMHVGGRYSRRRGRWRTTGDMALATTYNRTRLFATDITTTGGTVSVAELYQSDSSFLPILDFNFELGYNLTRDFGLRTGFHAMYMWDGIARANGLTTTENPNSTVGVSLDPTGLFEEGVMAAGFSFGMEWRR